MISLFARFEKKLRSDGLVSAAAAAIRFGIRKIAIPVTDLYYGPVAKRNSPIEYFGILIPTRHTVFNRKIRARFTRGTYEREEILALEKHLPEGYDVVDLGASTGLISAYSERRVGSKRKVIAVEANPHMISLIEEVKTLNGAEFLLDNRAYHSTKREVDFYVHKLSVGGSVQRQTQNQINIWATSLEQLFDEYDLKSATVICDIEGGEVDLIKNELEFLCQRCPLFVVETHWFAPGVNEVKGILRDSKLEKLEEIGNVMIYQNPKFSQRSISPP